MIKGLQAGSSLCMAVGSRQLSMQQRGSPVSTPRSRRGLLALATAAAAALSSTTAAALAATDQESADDLIDQVLSATFSSDSSGSSSSATEQRQAAAAASHDASASRQRQRSSDGAQTQNERQMGLPAESDLARRLREKGPRQAEPLTHGF